MKLYRPVRMLLAIALVFAILPGCGRTDTSVPPVPTIPNTADGTFATVVESLADKQPGVIWAAMPASYQSDVSSLVKEFAEKVDADIYNKTFELMGRMGTLLESRKDMFLASPMFSDAPETERQALSDNWDSVVGLFNTITQSELRTVDQLARMDVGNFLSTTGARAMKHFITLGNAMNPDEQFEPMMRGTKFEMVEGEENTIRITDPDGNSHTQKVTQVEGKWVPAEMAEEWSQTIAEMREQIAEMTAPENKAQIMAMLGGLEGAVSMFEKAEDQEAFDRAVNSIQEMLMGLMFGGMGGGMGPMNGGMNDFDF